MANIRKENLARLTDAIRKNFNSEKYPMIKSNITEATRIREDLGF